MELAQTTEGQNPRQKQEHCVSDGREFSPINQSMSRCPQVFNSVKNKETALENTETKH